MHSLNLVCTHPQHFKIHKNDGVFQKSVKITNIFNSRNLKLYNCTCGDYYILCTTYKPISISSMCLQIRMYILKWVDTIHQSHYMLIHSCSRYLNSCMLSIIIYKWTHQLPHHCHLYKHVCHLSSPLSYVPKLNIQQQSQLMASITFIFLAGKNYNHSYIHRAVSMTTKHNVIIAHTIIKSIIKF